MNRSILGHKTRGYNDASDSRDEYDERILSPGQSGEEK
jgi:hypothetical protein